jgi:ketosteroid isomerase-like protein
VSDRETNEAIVRRYAASSASNDLDELTRLRHPDWAVEWPQSGERVPTSESFAAIVGAYPGGRPHVEVSRIVGSEDRWFVTPGNTVLRVGGSGDFWWGEWKMTYPDGQEYQVIDLIGLRDGLVHRETVYWAPPFDAPDWRRPFVELPPN